MQLKQAGIVVGNDAAGKPVRNLLLGPGFCRSCGHSDCARIAETGCRSALSKKAAMGLVGSRR